MTDHFCKLAIKFLKKTLQQVVPEKKELIYFIKLVLSPWRQTTRKTSLRTEKYQQCLLLQIEETERKGNQLARSA